MLTPEILRSLSIKKRPLGQVLWAQFLRFNYWFSSTKITIEGWENIPQDRQVCLAMNHTDRFNYFPFQLRMFLERDQFTSAWVKGKYYENTFSRTFLLNTNNIPLASRGYVISALFKKELGRIPTPSEYRAIKDIWDRQNADSIDDLLDLSPQCRTFLGPNGTSKIKELEDTFKSLSEEVVRLSEETLKQGHHILVFPEGTRSIRMQKGHTGLAQMSQRMGVDIVPIGCSGSHLCHKGDLPWAKEGHIVYRVGRPLLVDGNELKSLRVEEPFTPFSNLAQERYGQRFQSITDIVMKHIAALVDPEHLPEPSDPSSAPEGSERFI